jgi:hypothetical protein
VFWHIAPADALLQQDVLRAEIGAKSGCRLRRGPGLA